MKMLEVNQQLLKSIYSNAILVEYVKNEEA